MSVSDVPLKGRAQREGRAMQKGQQTKAAIVEAALGLATQIGVEGLSIGDKVGTAVGGATLGFLLTWVGFHANVDQSPDTIASIRGIACLVPALLVGLCCLVIAFFRVTAARHGQILAALRQRADEGEAI